MYIQEHWTEVKNHGQDNEQRYGIGDSDIYETYTDDLGKLFKSLQREYGKCVSKVYQDTSDNKSIAIGWVFEKKMKYTDCNEYYLQETWVTLHNSLPIKTVKYDYHVL